MRNFKHIFHQPCSHCLCSHSGVMVVETLFSAHESTAGTFQPQRRVCSCGCLSMPDWKRDTLSKEEKTSPSLQERNGGKESGTCCSRSLSQVFQNFFASILFIASICIACLFLFAHRTCIPVTSVSVVFNLVQLSSCHLMLFWAFPKQKNALAICVMI